MVGTTARPVHRNVMWVTSEKLSKLLDVLSQGNGHIPSQRVKVHEHRVLNTFYLQYL